MSKKAGVSKGAASIKAKKEFVAQNRARNYIASLRLEGLSMSPASVGGKKSKADVIAKYKAKAAV